MPLAETQDIKLGVSPTAPSFLTLAWSPLRRVPELQLLCASSSQSKEPPTPTPHHPINAIRSSQVVGSVSTVSDWENYLPANISNLISFHNLQTK